MRALRNRRAALLAGLLFGLVLFVAASPAGWAGVPNEKAVPAYAEEQTILHLEQRLPAPGMQSAASGIQHFDRHFIVPPGRMPEQDVVLQRGGNTWRVLRNGPLATAMAALLVTVLLHRLVNAATEDRAAFAKKLSIALIALGGVLVLLNLYAKKFPEPCRPPTTRPPPSSSTGVR